MCANLTASLTRATIFFFSSTRRHTRYWRDWSSDVCSSDLRGVRKECDLAPHEHAAGAAFNRVEPDQRAALADDVPRDTARGDTRPPEVRTRARSRHERSGTGRQVGQPELLRAVERVEPVGEPRPLEGGLHRGRHERDLLTLAPANDVNAVRGRICEDGAVERGRAALEDVLRAVRLLDDDAADGGVPLRVREDPARQGRV